MFLLFFRSLILTWLTSAKGQQVPHAPRFCLLHFAALILGSLPKSCHSKARRIGGHLGKDRVRIRTTLFAKGIPWCERSGSSQCRTVGCDSLIVSEGFGKHWSHFSHFSLSWVISPWVVLLNTNTDTAHLSSKFLPVIQGTKCHRIQDRLLQAPGHRSSLRDLHDVIVAFETWGFLFHQRKEVKFWSKIWGIFFCINFWLRREQQIYDMNFLCLENTLLKQTATKRQTA